MLNLFSTVRHPHGNRFVGLKSVVKHGVCVCVRVSLFLAVVVTLVLLMFFLTLSLIVGRDYLDVFSRPFQILVGVSNSFTVRQRLHRCVELCDQ